jgi:hypothetical protein
MVEEQARDDLVPKAHGESALLQFQSLHHVSVAEPLVPLQPLTTQRLALHAAVLAGDNWLMSADWPGYYYEAVEKVFGPGTQALFLQGRAHHRQALGVVGRQVR